MPPKPPRFIDVLFVRDGWTKAARAPIASLRKTAGFSSFPTIARSWPKEHGNASNGTQDGASHEIQLSRLLRAQ